MDVHKTGKQIGKLSLEREKEEFSSAPIHMGHMIGSRVWISKCS